MLKFKYGECAMLDRPEFFDEKREWTNYDIQGWDSPDNIFEYTWLKCSTFVIVLENYWNEDFYSNMYKILYQGSIYYVLENCLLKIGEN